jgi:hypothetical protein
VIIIYFIFATISTWAAQPTYWSHLLEVTERHEFYQNHEALIKPKDSWQHLFSLVYIDSDVNRLKDCVFYKVPGQESGILKIKTITASENCEKHLLLPSENEVAAIKSLSFALLDSGLNLDITFDDFRSEKWQAKVQSSFTKPVPKMSMSSAEFKTPPIIFLAPKSSAKALPKKAFLKNGSVCHAINEDCAEVSPIQCDQCSEGWYEIPNGCTHGPKYCGRLECGGKDQPACRRGMRWQKKDEVTYECRMDSSFAYCSKGFTVQCDGKKAYCR